MANSALNAGASRRLFLGIEMPAFVQAGLVALQADLPGARWQWPEDMHMTLRFLGDVQAPRQTRIGEVLRQLDLAPFDLRVRGVGMFSGKVFWAGIEPNERLEGLKRRVDELLAQAGIPVENRPFVPHVTLAGTPGSPKEVRDRFLQKHSAFELAFWTVRHLTLFRSDPGSAGPIYRIVERYPLEPGQS